MHTKMKGNRDLCLHWGSEYPQTHTGCGLPGSTAQVKDVGFLVDRKSHMSQQWEAATSRANVTVASTSGGTMSRGGRRYPQVSLHPGNGVHAGNLSGKGALTTCQASDMVARVGGGSLLLLLLYHSPYPLSLPKHISIFLSNCSLFLTFMHLPYLLWEYATHSVLIFY